MDLLNALGLDITAASCGKARGLISTVVSTGFEEASPVVRRLAGLRMVASV